MRNLYQNDEDIDYAENQAVSQVETSISNLRANLTHIENQKKELEARAAQMDIAGQPLSRLLLSNIDQAQIEKRNLNEAITRKRNEKDQLTRDYAYDRSVFALSDCSSGLPEEPPFLAGQTE